MRVTLLNLGRSISMNLKKTPTINTMNSWPTHTVLTQRICGSLVPFPHISEVSCIYYTQAQSAYAAHNELMKLHCIRQRIDFGRLPYPMASVAIKLGGNVLTHCAAQVCTIPGLQGMICPGEHS